MANWATKEGFFKCKVPREKKTVPGLGDVYIYGLTCGEKDDYENKVVSVKAGSRQVKLTNASAVMLQLCVHDQHGNRMFGEGDIGKLISIPVAVAEPILAVAKRLSCIGPGEIEELVKNSQTDPAQPKGDCDSGSQQSSE